LHFIKANCAQFIVVKDLHKVSSIILYRSDKFCSPNHV
jgi:hypothetical protein